MIERIEHLGKLIDDCSIPGERRADGVAPAHGNGIQLSRDRFLLLNSTLRFRGVDDNCSIAWQLRRDSYDGPIVREGLFAKSVDDWYPLGEKYRCVRQYGHPAAFGVPLGALVEGRRVTHENVFVVRWRRVARVFVPEGGYLMWRSEPAEVRARTMGVEWCQFRYDPEADDLEIIMEARDLRQAGFEEGPEFCERPVTGMNAGYVQAVPANPGTDEWLEVNSFDFPADLENARMHAVAGHGRVGVLKYRFKARDGLYEWVATGPMLGPGVFEGNISPYQDGWLIAARRSGREPGVAWWRAQDPLGMPEGPVVSPDVACAGAPLSVYRCADGITRLCAGDASVSPFASNRDPIFTWDIDPDDGFRASNRRKIFSPREDGVTIPADHGPLADMVKFLPHAGGRSQVIIHRVRTCAMAVREADYSSRIRPLTEGDFRGTAIYHAKAHFTGEHPATWSFEEESR